MISTKDAGGESTGGGLPKLIQPGEHVLKINSVSLKRFSFMEADAGYYLMLNVETKPIEGFEGFYIDNDESKGRHEGQIGEIKTNRYYYRDGKTPSGVEISRDMEIAKAIRKVCMAANRYDWYESVDNKYKTIEDFIDGFNESDVYKGKWFKMTVAGKEYEKKNGYTGYDLYFPKLTAKGLVNIEAEEAKPSRLISFNSGEHFIKLEPKEVTGFGDDVSAEEMPFDVNNNTDFDL